MRRFLAVAVGGAAGLLVTVAIAYLVKPPLPDLTAHRLRAALALVALVLVVAEARRKRPVPKSVAQAIAAASCVLGVAAYYGFLSPVDERIVHRHDIFHYYLGAKYHDELSYTRIYACTALAQAENGQGAEVRSRTIRVLDDDRLAPGAEVLASAPDTCRTHFDDVRWKSFVDDVRILRDQITLESWNEIQVDHGYNPPPTWTVAGSTLASLHAPTPSFLAVLSKIDLALIAAMCAAVWWAFGLRTLALVLVFFGCQHPGNMRWLAGAFLRIDWLFFAVLGVAALAKRRHGVGGAALAAAALLRLFPVFLFAGPIVAIGARAWHTRRLSRGGRHFLAGAALASVVIVGGSTVLLGPRAWTDFASHIRVHRTHVSLNNVGLPALLQHDFSGDHDGGPDDTRADRWKAWRERRSARGRSLWSIQAVAVAGALGAIVAARRRPLWVTSILSLPLLAVALALSCYYWIILVLVAPLARVAPRIEHVVLGSVLVAELLATMPAFSGVMDGEYATQTGVFLVMLGVITARTWPKRLR